MNKNETTAALEDAIEILYNNALEKCYDDSETQLSLINEAREILKQEHYEPLIAFLGVIKDLNPIPDTLIEKLAVKFNCHFHILKFQIQYCKHSDDFNNNDHQSKL